MQLQELLEANKPLATAYVLKDALKEIWYAPSIREGWQRWRAWMWNAHLVCHRYTHMPLLVP